MIYILILILLLYFSFKYDYCPHCGIVRGKKKYAYVCMSIFLTLLVGIRYRIGLDTISYEESFGSIVPISKITFDILEDSMWDPLFYLFVSFSKSIFDEFWFFQLLQSIFVNSIVFHFFWKNSDHPFTALTFYFIFLFMSFSCETMRESCAVSMLLLGWEYLKKDKWIKFLPFVFLSIGFHTSAIALLIIPLLKITGLWNLLKINKKTILFLFVIMVCGTAISIYFFDYITLLNVSARFDARAASYAEENSLGDGLNLLGILSKLVQFAFYTIVSVITLKKISPEKLRPNQEQIIVLGLIFVFFSLSISILYRYQNYFMLFAYVAIADMFYNRSIIIGSKIRVKMSGFKSWVIFFIPAIIFWWAGLNQPVHGDSRYRHYMVYHPYSSIIFPKENSNREIVFNKYGL